MSSWNRRTIFKFSVGALFWAAFLALFLPFYSELLLAAVFAFAIEPFLGRVLRKRHLRWRASVALILIGMFIVLAVPVTVVVYKLYAQVIEVSKAGLQNTPLFQQLVVIRAEIVDFANQTLARFGLTDSIDLAGISEDGFSRLANGGLQVITGLVYKIPRMMISLFVFCAALYFFLAEAGPLKTIFQRQKLLTRAESDRLIGVIQLSSYNTVISSVLIAVMQASIVAIGALILKTGDLTVVWVVTFFCSFVPMIGAGPVALAMGAFKLVEGHYGAAIGFLLVAVVAGTMDNLVRPYLISSGESDLHPIVSLLAIIGGLIVFGMPGLFLGPVIASVTVKIIPTLQDQPPPEVLASGKEPAGG
jgi:predicted PurR-regulated permease PerM